MAELAGSPAQPPTGGGGGATPLAARALAPDLARGFMLLLIALANAHLLLYGQQLGVRGYPAALGPVDRTVAVLQLLFVDGRAYPLFALLLGYGIVQLARRQEAAGRDVPSIVSLVRRRGGWLLLIGFGHAALLFGGDIIGAYGLLTVAMAGALVGGPNRILVRLGVAGLLFTALLGVLQALPPPPGMTTVLPSLAQSNPLTAVSFRVVEWISGLTATLALFAAVALGAWAARRRMLDEPEQHRRLLVRLAVGGIGISVLGGLPLALIAAGYLGGLPTAAIAAAGALHAVSGYAGGIGYAALIGLIAARVSRRPGGRPGPVVTALAACGQRSMSCYLAQSVVFVAVLAAYGGGLGDQVGVAAASAIGAATWLLTVIAADVMRRFGIRGPAESLLRRLTYGPRPAT